MSLRQKILLMFSLTIALTAAAVGWAAAVRLRVLFDGQDRDRAAALVNQFVHEYGRRAGEITGKVERLAQDQRVLHIDDDLAHGNDTSGYTDEAGILAQEYGLDFLELTESDGTILSSAPAPAQAAQQDASAAVADPAPYLKLERLAGDKSDIGVFASRTAQGNIAPAGLRIVGGQRLDKNFVAQLSTPAGSMVYLYLNLTPGFEENNVTGATGAVANAARFQNLVDQVRTSRTQVTAEILRRNSEEQSVAITGVPLKAADGSVAAVLLVANSRESLIEAQEHIRAVAYGVAAIGILFAVLVSLWIAASVSRPIEQLAERAHDVAAGEWNVTVPVRSSAEEITTLGLAFNDMTRALVFQREQLIQSERVRTWRELARTVGYKLDERLVPLQSSVENLGGANHLSADDAKPQFERDITAITAEIASLRNLARNLNEFSSTPKPQLTRIDLREVVAEVVQPYEAALGKRAEPIRVVSELPPVPLLVEADAELLRRALSSVIRNSIDAAVRAGTLMLTAGEADSRVHLHICNSGQDMTEDECARVFTPSLTAGGDELGLASVQSIIADHHGTISVAGRAGHGTTFRIELPKALVNPEDHA